MQEFKGLPKIVIFQSSETVTLFCYVARDNEDKENPDSEDLIEGPKTRNTEGL